MAVKKVDWDGLIDDVFKEEVDQFLNESGVQSLNIKEQNNNWCRRQPSNSATHGLTTSSSFPSMSATPSLRNSQKNLSKTPPQKLTNIQHRKNSSKKAYIHPHPSQGQQS